MFDAGRRDAFYLLDASHASALHTETRRKKRKKTAFEEFENPGPSNVREFLADFDPVREKLEREGKLVSALVLEMVIAPSVKRVREEKQRAQEVMSRAYQGTMNSDDWNVYAAMKKSKRLLRIEDTAGPGIPGSYPYRG